MNVLLPSGRSSSSEGFGSYRISGEPRRVLRADRLRLQLDEMPPSGGLLLRPFERAADGLLRTGAKLSVDAREHRVEVRPIEVKP